MCGVLQTFQRWGSPVINMQICEITASAMPLCLGNVAGVPINATRGIIAIFCVWSCWTKRNKGNDGELRQTIDQFHSNVCNHVDERKQFFQKEVPKTIHVCKWEEPPSEWLKINIDASFSEATRLDG
jgi:hypothetical protein